MASNAQNTATISFDPVGMVIPFVSRYLGGWRRCVDDRGAAQVADVDVGLVGRRAVQCAAIVPDHQIAGAPAVAEYDVRPRGEGEQFGEQRAPLLDRPADDMRGV